MIWGEGEPAVTKFLELPQVSILRNIYNEMGEAQQFLELIQNIDHDYTKSELDSSTYSSAELQYVQENYQNSIELNE